MLHLAGRYDRATARITLQDATLDSDQLRAHVVGGMNLIYDGAGAIARLGVDLTADKTALAMPGTFMQPRLCSAGRAQRQLRAVDPRHSDRQAADHRRRTGARRPRPAQSRWSTTSRRCMEGFKGRFEPLAVRDLLALLAARHRRRARANGSTPTSSPASHRAAGVRNPSAGRKALRRSGRCPTARC